MEVKGFGTMSMYFLYNADSFFPQEMNTFDKIGNELEHTDEIIQSRDNTCLE